MKHNGLYVSFCYDIGENTGGAFCEVYDASLPESDRIDYFTIPNTIPEADWEAYVQNYLEQNY
mgnify:FL=1